MTVLYEDELVRIEHVAEASKGHVRVVPIQPVSRIEDCSDDLIEHIFFCGNYAAAILFELFAAHGTNIMLSEDGGRVRLDIIERRQDDGLNFLWKPKKVTPQDMDSIFSRLKDAIVIGKPKKEEKPIEVKQDVVTIDTKTPGKENYLVKHLDRIP